MNLLCDEIVFEKWFQVEQDGLYKIYHTDLNHEIRRIL